MDIIILILYILIVDNINFGKRTAAIGHHETKIQASYSIEINIKIQMLRPTTHFGRQRLLADDTRIVNAIALGNII